jgi:hypothetical protein
MLIKKDFQDTLQMMDACNASALLKSLNEIVPRIWEEADFYKKGTSWVNSHPIMLLWIGKIADLSYGRDAPYVKWTKAYNYVNAKANGLEVGKNIDMWLPENEYGILME